MRKSCRVPTQGGASLDALVHEFIRHVRPRIEEELAPLRRAGSITDAIWHSVYREDGKIWGHQRRVGRARLELFRERLLARKKSIAASEDFETLIARVRACGFEGIGPLTVYDTAQRIGDWLGLKPERVYLQAGARVGARRFGLPNRAIVELDEVPKALRRLSCDEIESFLCLYKDGNTRGVCAAGGSVGAC